MDNIEYLDYDTLGGLNLWIYCNNNPIMNVDPYGNKWWKKLFKVTGAVLLIGGITALSVITFGGAAIALGLSAAAVTSVMIGATIGGVVAGGLELGIQIVQNGIDNIDYKSIAIETITGSAMGAISGASSTTTSIGLRTGLRIARVGVSGINSIMHGINNGDSVKNIILNSIVSMGISAAIQGSFQLYDAKIVGLNSSILEQRYLEGMLSFGEFNVAMLTSSLTVKKYFKMIYEKYFN